MRMRIRKAAVAASAVLALAPAHGGEYPPVSVNRRAPGAHPLVSRLRVTLFAAVLAQGEKPAPIDRRELEPYVDALAARRMKECRAPGMAISVVQGTVPLLSKGYGLANIEANVAVSADSTRFCIASVTKSITATAAMQMVERGRLDLGADVNRYLADFRMPSTYPEPITLHHLLTHTSGLDESFIGAGVSPGVQITPLGKYLAAHAPARVAAPGELWSYSNYNYSLAGHLVELASGLPYATYVEREVLRPLGMAHSGFSLASGETADLAIAYSYEDGRYLPMPYPRLNDIPAGALDATASDMALFMIAHLRHGRHGEVRILEEATARRMHERQYSFHPGVPGMAYGFMETFHGGRRALAHEGNMGGFGALLYLVPELDLGFFVATNGGEDECDLWPLPAELLDRYYHPQERSPPPPRAADEFAARASRLEGVFRAARYSHATLEKAGVVLGFVREVEVRVAGEGTLAVGRGRFAEAAPMLFERVDREGRLGFRMGPGDRVDQLSVGMATTYVRVPWHGRSAFHRVILGISLLLFLWTAIAWPLGEMVRRLRRHPAEPDSLARAARRAAWLLAAFGLCFLGGLGAPFFGSHGSYWLFFGIPAWVRVVLGIPFLVIAAAAATAVLAVVAWRRRFWSSWGRVFYTALALAGVCFSWSLHYWNLVGFKY